MFDKILEYAALGMSILSILVSIWGVVVVALM